MAVSYRVTRTTLRGTYADDRCFLDWIASFPTANVRIIDWRDDPQNNGGSNDRRWYLWFHDIDLKAIDCPGAGNPDLISSGGTNSWDTEAKARTVYNGQISQSLAIKKEVDAKNAAAVSAENIAKGVAGDVVEGAKDVVTGEAFGTAGKIAAAAGIAFLLILLAKLARKG